MTGCTTWEALGPLAPPVLVVANSAPDRPDEVRSTLRIVKAAAPARGLRVIAPPAFVPLVGTLGVASDRIRSATVDGAELELNFFLEHERALDWIACQRPRTIVGTSPHSLYNEEVKELFEQRVLRFIGRATFLAHALPAPYVYALGPRDLLERTTRPVKIAAYESMVEALLADFHRQWESRERPAVDDAPDYRDVAETLERHLGPALVAYDERSPIPSAIAAAPDPALVARARRSRVDQIIRAVRCAVRRWAGGVVRQPSVR